MTIHKDIEPCQSCMQEAEVPGLDGRCAECHELFGTPEPMYSDPIACPHCDSGLNVSVGSYCTECSAQFDEFSRLIGEPTCDRCGTELEETGECNTCVANRMLGTTPIAHWDNATSASCLIGEKPHSANERYSDQHHTVVCDACA